MAIGLGAKLARLLLLTFNLIFWLSGIGLVGTGIWLLYDSSQAIVFATVEAMGTSTPVIRIGAYAIIGIGCFVIAVGFLGCCGAMHENRCMLVTYFAVILIILLAELVGGILVLVYKQALDEGLQQNMKDNLAKNYGMNVDEKGEGAGKQVTDGFNYAQFTFQCCGVSGPDDYTNSSWYNVKVEKKKVEEVVPLSCCLASKNNYTDVVPENLSACYLGAPPVPPAKGFRYSDGCYQQVKNFVGSANGILIGVGVGIAGLELLGMVFAICLCRNIDYDI